MMQSTQLKIQELTKNQFPKTHRVLEAGLTEEVSPGFVAGYWHRDLPNQISLTAYGNRRIIPSPQPMLIDTVFDLASVSKVFATATLAATLVERGWLSWETSLSTIFPSYPYTDVKIKHLLSHTAGYTAWQPFWEKMRNYFSPEPLYAIPISYRQRIMRELVFSVAPEVKPGTRAVYSDLSFLLLGFALEEIVRMPLDQAVRRFVWQPMGIQGAYYRRIGQSPGEAVDDRVAATEDCPWRGGVLQGQVHDDNCWAMGGYAGHTGVFSTATDVLHFARGLMLGFLSPGVLQAVWSRVTEPEGCVRTLGWDTPSGDLSSAGRLFSESSVGHLGFTGSSLWIDPKVGLAVVLLTNRVHPSRENVKIRDFRPRFHEAIRRDLGF